MKIHIIVKIQNYIFVQDDQSVPELITKTYLYNFDPLKRHFYIVNLGFTGVCIIFLISAKKHLCFEQKYEKYQKFYLKTFSFWW